MYISSCPSFMKDVETEFCPIFSQQKGCLRLEVAHERRLFGTDRDFYSKVLGHSTAHFFSFFPDFCSLNFFS